MFKSITIPSGLVEQLLDRAMQTPTIEVCGMLGGKILDQHIQVITQETLTNVAEQPSYRYEFAPPEFIQKFYAWQARQIEWVGIYHSHPTGDLAPSPSDIAEAHYENIVYLIMGGTAQHWQLKAWHIRKQEVISLPLYITS